MDKCSLSELLPESINGHDWFVYRGLIVCQNCGLVLRKDGQNKPCKGIVKVSLREEGDPQ